MQLSRTGVSGIVAIRQVFPDPVTYMTKNKITFSYLINKYVEMI